MQHCDREHKDRCTKVRFKFPPLQGLKLIDCERRQIVPALPSYQYSALSYVWGTSRSGDDRCIHDRLPTTLPRTVEDALKVTKELDIQYIWIDRYCIDQENNDEKRIQIKQMDLIYQNAVVTIVAAAGTDPYFGLPGVGATARTPQSTAWIGGRCLVSSLSDPRLVIRTSKWMKRAWTYQERVFSTRRITFTEQQVSYECQAGYAKETVDHFWGPIDVTMSVLDGPWDIFRHLSGYCGRELSVDSDAIRAVEGVFQSYRKRELPVHHYLGVPIIPSVYEGPLGELDHAERSRGESFALGLSWCNTAPATRRTLFPTWSWAGWTAPMRYPLYFPMYESAQFKAEVKSPLKVFVENSDGSISDMDKQSDVSLDQVIPGFSSEFIHIEAWTIPIDIHYMPDGAVDCINKVRSYGLSDGNVSGYFAIFQDDRETVQVPLYSLHQTYENDITERQSYAPDSKDNGLLGVILDSCETMSDRGYFDNIFILVVNEKDHYYERVGHILLNSLTMRSSLNDDGRHCTHTDSDSGRLAQLCLCLRERRTIRLG